PHRRVLYRLGRGFARADRVRLPRADTGRRLDTWMAWPRAYGDPGGVAALRSRARRCGVAVDRALHRGTHASLQQVHVSHGAFGNRPRHGLQLSPSILHRLSWANADSAARD